MGIKNNTISTRISTPMYEKVKEVSDELMKNKSDILRDALYFYLDKNPDIELQGTNKVIIQNRELYIDAERENRFIELENTNVSATLKENTFIEFMDGFLAQIYISNKPYMGTEDVKKIMKESLKAMRNRAEHHGFMSHYKYRLEDPIAYAEEFLDRKATEKEAFEDSNFSPSLNSKGQYK